MKIMEKKKVKIEFQAEYFEANMVYEKLFYNTEISEEEGIRDDHISYKTYIHLVPDFKTIDFINPEPIIKDNKVLDTNMKIFDNVFIELYGITNWVFKTTKYPGKKYTRNNISSPAIEIDDDFDNLVIVKTAIDKLKKHSNLFLKYKSIYLPDIKGLHFIISFALPHLEIVKKPNAQTLVWSI